jgi:hypothetical protein
MANKEALPKFQGLGGLGILLILMWTAILGSLGLLFPAMGACPVSTCCTFPTAATTTTG